MLMNSCTIVAALCTIKSQIKLVKLKLPSSLVRTQGKRCLESTALLLALLNCMRLYVIIYYN